MILKCKQLKAFSSFAENNISFMEVPAHCTDHLQSLDLSINKPVKDHFKASLQEWYAIGIRQRVLAGIDDKKLLTSAYHC